MKKIMDNRLPIKGGIRERSIFVMKIKSVEGNILCGSFSNCYMKEEVTFHGLEDFFLKADRFCDEIGSPMNTVEYRSINQITHSAAKSKVGTSRREKDKYHLVEQITSEAFTEKSFLIWLLFRNNASWQGEVFTKNPSGIGFRNRVAFRSVFELMKLLIEGVESEKEASCNDRV